MATRNRFAPTATALLLLALAGLPGGVARGAEDGAGSKATEPAAAGVDTSRWQCRLCPYPEGWYGTLAFGPGYVSDPSLKFGDYRGLDEKGGFAAVEGDLHYRNAAGHYFDLYARDLGLDSRQLDLRGGDQGRYEFRLAWREIPKFRGHGTQTPFLGAGGAVLTLPAGWQGAAATQDLPELAASLAEARLGLERKSLDAGLTLKFASRWSYEINYRHDEKDGTRPFGAGVFMINSTHFPAPVDFTTDQFDMGLSVAGERAHLRLGFVGSEFSNGYSSITWQNPFTAIPGTETLRAALEPDNEFYQFNLSGSYAPGARLRFSGRAAWGRMEQDDPFLPGYSINPQFSDLPLPRLSYAGEVDSRSLYVAGTMVARLSDRLDLVARVKRDERDNDSPVDLYTPVITDLVLGEPRPNRPYGFEREQYRLELGHRTLGWLRLAAGGQHERVERSLQSVHATREDSGWGEVTVDPWAWVQLRLRLEKAQRDAAPYEQLDDGGPFEHPLQRKYHLADRDRDRAVVELDLAPVDRLGVSLSWYASDDDYEESVIGLQGSTDRNLSLDLSYAVNDAATIHGFATREDIESTIASAVDDAALPWHGTTDDRFLTFGLGATFRASERLTFGFDYVASDSKGRVVVDTGVGEDPFPDLKTDLRNVRLHLSCRFNEHWSGKLYAEHERYDSADWYLDGLGVDGIPAILTLGELSPDYDVTVVRLLATYRF